MKQPKKIYLEKDLWRQLEVKAEALGLTGRGSLSKLLEKLATNGFILLDANAKLLLSSVTIGK